MISQKKYLREWREKTDVLGAHNIVCAGVDLWVDQGVFSPDIQLTYSTQSIIDNMGNVDGKSVMDMGTGSGILAILAGQNKASSVVAADISSVALGCARININKAELSKIIRIVSSNLFSNIDSKFDVILANLPILINAENYELYSRFLNQAKNHLSSEGCIKFSSASFGKIAYLERLFIDLDYIVNTKKVKKHGVDWFLYTLTNKNR